MCPLLLPSPGVSRRGFLTSAAAAAGAVAIGCSDRSVTGPSLAGLVDEHLPDPASSGIEHIILLMMENRSFDHFLGWLPGGHGRQAGLTYVDTAGVEHETFPLAPDFQGCGHGDPNHSYEGARIEYAGGRCDGWLRVNDLFSIGYYRQEDLPFFGRAAPGWTSLSRYFCAFMGPTFPNRIYQQAAQTDRLTNTLVVSTLPTIWDRLASHGRTGRYYYSDIPTLSLWGPKYIPISRRISAFYDDCAAGTLPDVAFVDPDFLGEATGTGADDHPFNDVRAGEAFLNRIYAAVTSSPAWPHTVLFINFDEWGGFFDHVRPPVAPIPGADRAAGATDGLRGFRTANVLISPFARRGHTPHRVYDHTSVLRMIEWRWHLPPLTVRDRTANNLALELDVARPNVSAPVYAVPPAKGAVCPYPKGAAPAGETLPGTQRTHWIELRAAARQYGWPV